MVSFHLGYLPPPAITKTNTRNCFSFGLLFADTKFQKRILHSSMMYHLAEGVEIFGVNCPDLGEGDLFFHQIKYKINL